MRSKYIFLKENQTPYIYLMQILCIALYLFTHLDTVGYLENNGHIVKNPGTMELNTP